MCGIVGYTGYRDAFPVVVKGLKRLEYRGYDSAGIALHNQSLHVYKKMGKVADLEEHVVGKNITGKTGIGHTRWATHGEPSDKNAHPHLSASGKLAMIHNGIIENYYQLKQELLQKGYQFKSDTDTEVLLNFIDEIKENNHCSLEEAVRIALKRVTGAYVILLIEQDAPDTILAARKGSPLVIGVGKGEHFLGSDASPMLEYTKEVVYVNDYELAIIRPDELILKNLGNEVLTPYVQKLDIELAAIEKGGFDHFMLKEIFEQPQTIYDCLRGRLDAHKNRITLSGIEQYAKEICNANRIIMVACGTSWHAGLTAEYIFEECCRINVEVEYASEFRYRNPVIHPGDVIIAISQSGETADTLVAIENAKAKGAIILGVVNVVGSSIARISHAGAYTHAGPEIGVASTGYNFPVALEGALKLKEISYIHAEGYPAAEMKHGPIALVDEQLPVVFVATKDSYHEKVISNMQEIKARKGKVIAVISEGDETATTLSESVMTVPVCDEMLAPLLTVVPLQLLAYYIGVERGCDVDKPRNLAKSVTVE